MITAAELSKRARLRLRALERRRKDPRYVRTMGRFVQARLLTTNHALPTNREKLRVEDVLWAGEVEPRLLELLPALLVKRPAMFVDNHSLPSDLDAVVRRLRRNLEPPAFRCIPGADLWRWLPKVGRKDHVPARLKAFRLTPDDLRLLDHLSEKLGVSQTEVIRRGLRALV